MVSPSPPFSLIFHLRNLPKIPSITPGITSLHSRYSLMRPPSHTPLHRLNPPPYVTPLTWLSILRHSHHSDPSPCVTPRYSENVTLHFVTPSVGPTSPSLSEVIFSMWFSISSHSISMALHLVTILGWFYFSCHSIGVFLSLDFPSIWPSSCSSISVALHLESLPPSAVVSARPQRSLGPLAFAQPAIPSHFANTYGCTGLRETLRLQLIMRRGRCPVMSLIRH